MAKKSNIGWLHRILPDGAVIDGHTFNPWWGCFKVAQGCTHCYAEGLATRYGKHVWGPAATTERWTFGAKHWTEPLTWNREAEALGHRMSVFCASMADVFEDHPQVESERAKLWPLIEQTPWLNWLLLTKRPWNIMNMAPYGETWPDNVWVGTSIAKQLDVSTNVPYLVDVPAVVHFLSVEPQLEKIDLFPWARCLEWTICGGESGPKHRPFDLDWARSLRDQCQASDVPFFFKQVGGRTHSAGGRDLDGGTWDEMPPERPVLQTSSV
jgi:protein gp37